MIDPKPCDWFTCKPQEHDWMEAYLNATEELPPDMLTPMRKLAWITCYVDANHAHDKITHRSITGILLFINGTPIKWISK